MILHRLCSHYTCTDLYPYALTNALVLLDYRMKPDLQSKTSHLHGIRELPIFAQPSNLLTTEKAIGVLLFSGLTEESICSRLPVSVDINAVFVVDLNKLLLRRILFVMTWGRGCGEAVTDDWCP